MYIKVFFGVNYIIKTGFTWACKLCFLLFVFSLPFENVFAKKGGEDTFADSVMNRVFERSELYGKYIVEYNSRTYIKGTTSVLRKNFLFRFAPDYFSLDKKNDNTIIESIAEIHFQAPNNFTQKIIAVNGTNIGADDISRRVMQFLNINVYNPTSFNDEILMPTVKKAFKYYRFYYESDIDTMNYKILKIRIEPRIKSQKLLAGYIYVVDKLWAIARIDVEGKWDFSEFHVKTSFGLPEKNFLVPTETELFFRLKLLGNEVVNSYSSRYDYTFIKKYENEAEKKKISMRYDLSDHFNVELDTLPVVKDSLFWEANRPIPLTKREQDLYDQNEKEEQLSIDTSVVSRKRSWNFAKGIIIPKQFQYNATQFRYSGLLNPLKLAYSKLDGIVYWQQLKLNKTLDSGQEINFSPNIGFVFERKEVFFNIPLKYLFAPGQMGRIEFSLGNRNQSYNSKIIDEIQKEIPDSIDFEDLNLKYYKHYYVELMGRYELLNGFLGHLGVDYHLYKPIKSEERLELRYDLTDDIENLIDKNYKLFTPVIGLQWTPNQYYRINGKKKEYVGSFFPTLSAEYARGISGILGSNGNYERLEMDIQQNISLGLLRSVQYYAGAGIFTNTQSIYFADFHKFTKRNFPQSWDDGIGGVFQLLDSYWYNASNSYVQFHAMYEAPFVVLQLFRNVTKDIFKERIYLSQLYTPVLPCYTELGYGVGNYIFNMGVFVSLNKGEYNSFGFKFAFELF